jgi:DNA-binding transcriptional LysR family regulator
VRSSPATRCAGRCASHPDKAIRKGAIPLAALKEATWLLREEGSGTREIINQLLVPYLHHLRPGIEFGNPEAIKRAAAAGLGISCLSRFVVADLLKTGVLVAPPTELPHLTRHFYLVMHRQKRRTRGLDLLISHLNSVRARPDSLSVART